ncbi:MAG: hypothetical protein ACREYA_13350 [Cupriavidus necator]
MRQATAVVTTCFAIAGNALAEESDTRAVRKPAADDPRIWVIDELVSDAGRWRYEAGMAYASTQADGYRGYSGGLIQIGPNQYLPVLSSIGPANGQTDQFIGTAGIRYGITARTEVALRGSGTWSSVRSYDAVRRAQDSNQEFNSGSASLALTHRLYRGANSSLIAFGSIGVFDRIALAPYGTKRAYLNNLTLGMSGYVVNDPIILSLSGSGTFSRRVSIGPETYRNGNIFSLVPAISFVANEQITLTAGLQF